MAFTWFDKFTEVLAAIPDENQRHALEVALVEYGAFGAEPDLCYPLCAMFAALRDDMDNSRSMRARGAGGGRPRKQKPEVSENGKPEVSENSKPNPNQSNPIQ